jgi:hypothetical protein
MTAERIAQLTDKVQAHQLTGARPVATTDGVDITPWRSGAYGPIAVQVYLDGTAPANITAPTGGTAGVELWAFKLGQWWRAATLNGGNSIPIVGDTLGETERVDFLGGFDRLFTAGTASAGTATAQFVPYEVVR